jgi:hypothetical protein
VQIADDDVNRAYSKFETSFIEIIDKHIPIKKRKPVAYPVPCNTLSFSSTYDHTNNFILNISKLFKD